jgi:hypothetical protein
MPAPQISFRTHSVLAHFANPVEFMAHVPLIDSLAVLLLL